MKATTNKPSFFDRLKRAMQDSVAYSRGELTLATTTLPTPPPKAGPSDVASLRRRLRMSQAVFAATLNVSTKTVQSWEQGAREPSDVALRMLQVIREWPDVLRTILGNGDAVRGTRPRVTKREGGRSWVRRSRKAASKNRS